MIFFQLPFVLTVDINQTNKSLNICSKSSYGFNRHHCLKQKETRTNTNKRKKKIWNVYYLNI
jgi:hypothetical protein